MTDIIRLLLYRKRAWIGDQQAETIDDDEYAYYLLSGVADSNITLSNIIWKQAKMIEGYSPNNYVGNPTPNTVSDTAFNDSVTATWDFSNNPSDVKLTDYAYKAGQVAKQAKDETFRNLRYIQNIASYLLDKDSVTTLLWDGTHTLSLFKGKNIKYALSDAHVDNIRLYLGDSVNSHNQIAIEALSNIGTSHRIATSVQVTKTIKGEDPDVSSNGWLIGDGESKYHLMGITQFNNSGTNLDTWSTIDLKKIIIESFDVFVCMYRVNQELTTQDSLTTIKFNVDICNWIYYKNGQLHVHWEIKAYPGREQKQGSVYIIQPTIY